MRILNAIKDYFSESSRERRKEIKILKTREMFEAEFQRLNRKRIVEKLKSEIREHELKAKETSQVASGLVRETASFGGAVKRGLDSMSQNLRYNSRPLQYRHSKRNRARRYMINSPMAFALMPSNNYNPNRRRKRNYLTSMDYL